jgi:hypothetical protein
MEKVKVRENLEACNGEEKREGKEYWLLENVEVRFAHYLVENKIWQDPTHVLCSA